MNTQDPNRLMRRIKICIWTIILGLGLSGLTAFPIESELELLLRYSTDSAPALWKWLHHVFLAVKMANKVFPFLSYGTDWLAFAHLMLALLFIGPLKNPVKNIWVIEFGMMACILIFPLAFIAGSIRGIPFFWQLIDCSFGAIGFIPLFVCYSDIKRLQNFNKNLLLIELC